MYSRREFGRWLAAGALSGSTLARTAFGQAKRRIDSRVGGVLLGAQSYSFRDKPFDGMLAAFVEIGLGECELWQTQVEPRVKREELREWRTSVSLDELRKIRKQFDDAGVNLFAYNYSFKDDFSDQEIDRGFEMAKALGVDLITASATVTAAKRVVAFADRHKMRVAYHGHSNARDDNEFAKPESFEAALAMSPRFDVNLDIGHFTATNYDPVAFIQKHHARIPVLHLKDRKKNDGPNTVWGQGDTPIKEVLRLLKREKYPMRALIEYEYKGESDSVTEVKKCFTYCREALA